jgi:hypothetical protein
MKNRVQGAEGSRIQVKGKEVKPLNPGILEPWFIVVKIFFTRIFN